MSSTFLVNLSRRRHAFTPQARRSHDSFTLFLASKASSPLRYGHDERVSATAAEYPPPRPGGGYALRGVAVIDSLDDLSGPVHEMVRLPLHLDASAAQDYDLDNDYFRRLLYRVVLLEASCPEDLTSWLDRDTLVREWPLLYLPRVVRAAWESRHPILRQRGAGPDVPQA